MQPNGSLGETIWLPFWFQGAFFRRLTGLTVHETGVQYCTYICTCCRHTAQLRCVAEYHTLHIHTYCTAIVLFFYYVSTVMLYFVIVLCMY